MDVYIRKILKVSVAQICQTIGYNSIQTIPLELLIDSLHKFLQEFARDLHRHVELFNRTEANLDDVALSLQSLNVGVNDLLEYMGHVQPVACCVEIPELPAFKQSNLNFLKPGSKEVLTRPVHIYEHLPPILRDNSEIDDKSQIPSREFSPISTISNATNPPTNCNEIEAEELLTKTNGMHIPADTNENSDPNILVADSQTSTPASTENRKKSGLEATVSPPPAPVSSSATREISSVMMTSGGFISPAIEGRMPECIIPDIVEKYLGLDAPPAAIPPPISLAQTSTQFGKTTTVLSTQMASTSGSMRDLAKKEESFAPSAGNKVYEGLDKKLLKKVKKKSLLSMGPPNIGGIVPVMPNDKAQRKRIKMLQKSMAKNSPNSTNAVFKTKNGSGFVSGGQQEKFRKKQYKLRQKQIHQLAQKQDQVSESGFPTSISGAAGGGGKIPTPANAAQSAGFGGGAGSSAGGSSGKTKKDYFVMPSQVGDDVPADAGSSNTFVPSASFHPFKGNMYNDVTVGPQDVTMNTPGTSSQQTVLHGPPSPQYDEVKLNNEPDRSKLNIFKKISSSRKERSDSASTALTASTSTAAPNPIPSAGEQPAVGPSSNTTIFSNDQVISLPSGTTITPAPPSGSGRHVYAPPPSQSGDFDSVVQVDDDGSIPEGSAVLMKRGDLMIHKPKKRGRKPGSKNQPKILGFPTKKAKKLKKTLFGSHANTNLLEPLNLSHSSIANIANIPLGIASTFPLDTDTAIKLKKDRKKAKLGKDPNFIRGTGKAGSSRNLPPTKEEFASINQKLMMMDTVLQATPPFPPNIPSAASSKATRPNSPSLEVSNAFPIEPESSTAKVKKERKKAKQSKDQKLLAQQCNQPLSVGIPGSNKTPPNMGMSQKSPQSYTPNFSNVSGLSMFSFYPFTPKPGLIPSHSLFSQIPNIPNIPNNGLFMSPLINFPPLNPPIRSFKNDEKEPTPPLLQAGEGNYSKVAPLVPDTMKLDFPQSSHTSLSNSTVSGSKTKTSCITSSTSTRTSGTTTNASSLTPESTIGPATSAKINTISNFGDLRKKMDEHNSSAGVSSSSNTTITSLRNVDVTIEVSSDDSVQETLSSSKTKFSSHTAMTSVAVSSTSFHSLLQPVSTFSASESVHIVNDNDVSPTERRNKEHKKLKKLGKQIKKHSTISALNEPKTSARMDSTGGVGGPFDKDLSVMIPPRSESAKKADEANNTSSHAAAYDYQISPERRKDHKKMKKLLKEGKLKKKKDKKDKNRNKEKSEKIIKPDKSEKRKEDKKDKDKLKKLKKEKKKDKQRSDMDLAAMKNASSAEGSGSATEVATVVPKLTLKLGQSATQSPTQVESSELKKTSQKTGLVIMNTLGGGGGKPAGSAIGTASGREPSPELARISPLVTRPPKQKSGIDEPAGSCSVVPSSTGLPYSGSHQTPSLSASLNIIADSVIDIDSNSGGPITSTLPASATILGLGMNANSQSSPATNAIIGSSTAASTSMHATNTQHSQHQASNQSVSSNKHSTAVPLLSETNRPSSYIDAEGNRVWICPACGKVDDGSAMIGCDGCDAWYHWVCVGIHVAPKDNEDWYCRVCIAKKRGTHSGDRKRKRNKKKNLNL